MRIVNRKEFLSLPSGTVYAELDKESIGDLKFIISSHDRIEIKGDSLDNDWYYSNLAPDAKCNDSGELIDQWCKMNEGEEVEGERCYERDGFFDKENYFIIFNKEEIKMMIDALKEVLEKKPE